MQITKEAFMNAGDPKNRDEILFDMLFDISNKLDDCKKLEEEIDGYSKEISVIKGTMATMCLFLTGAMSWIGFK